MSTRIERMREVFSTFVLEWFERSLEFGLAAGTILNGTQVFGQRPDGSSLAPFLTSALAFLVYDPRYWALTLIILGVLHHSILLYSIYSEILLLRLAMAGFLFLMYLVVAIAVLTGSEPAMASYRYFLSSGLSLGVFTAICIMSKTVRTVGK